MPAAVVAVAGSWVATNAAVIATLGTFGAAVAGFATTTILGAALGLNKPPTQSLSSLNQGVLLNTAGTVDPLVVVYGQRRVGGTRIFCETNGPKNKYLHVVIAHCEGEVEAVEQLYIDEVPITDEKFTDLVTYETFLGSDDQAACATLMAEFPDKWTAEHRLRGVCYTYIRFKYSTKAFHGMPIVTADIKGRKVYDPRSGLTAWSNNPALCVLDYLTNARYGRGISSIDTADFITAANACDVTISDGDGGTVPMYSCNGVVNTDQSSDQNTMALLSACRGMLVFTAAGYGLVVDKAEVPIDFTFSEDNIAGAWTFSPGGKRTRFNRVRGNWFNPDRDWQPDIYPADSSAFRAIDNGLMLESNLDLPFTTVRAQAHRLTEQHLRQSRFGMSATFHAFLAGMFCRVGDVVPVTHSTPGWVNKPFRIMRISLLSSDEVEVEVREYDDAVYEPAPLTAPRVTPLTSLPDPNAVSVPTGLVLSAGNVVQPDGTAAPRLVAQWDVADSVWVAGWNFSWREDSGAWETFFVAEPYVTLPLVKVGSLYEARVSAVGTMGAESDFCTIVSRTATGPVPSITSVSSTESLVVAAGAVVSKVSVVWAASGECSFVRLAWRINGGAWTTVPDIYGQTADLILPDAGLLEVSITPYSIEAGDAVIHAVTVAGKTAPPSNVSGLGINYAGRQALLNWNPAVDLDVIVGGWLWVRHTPVSVGAVWGNASDLLPSVPGTATSAPVPVMAGTYLARWIDSSGNLSPSASALVVDGSAVADMNVVVDQSEAPGWTGAKTNMTESTGALVLTDPASLGSYRTAAIDLGSVAPARVSAAVTFGGFVVADMIDARTALIDTWADIDGALVEDVSAEVWFSATNDNPAGSPSWSAWAPLRVATDYRARAYRFELRCGAATPDHNISVSALDLFIDVEDRSESGSDVVSGAGACSVTFARPFFAVPAVGITAHGMATGDYYTLSGKSENGFTVTFKNAAGTAISRTFDWIAKGY